MGVSSCPECEAGVLVLDPASIPKWKLVCNKCDVIVRLFEDAAKVSVNSEESCPECEAQLVKVIGLLFFLRCHIVIELFSSMDTTTQ
jgi:DNA topoisomerase III